jgi:1,4-alpha-glucan branching enzyme
MAKTATKHQNLKTQTFLFTAPTAMSVQLVGDFTQWQKFPIPMQKGPGGVWRATVKLQPGEHHYRFLVDGEWRDDPECALRVPNPFGTQNSVRKVA